MLATAGKFSKFIIYFWAYRPRPLFCKFFLIEPQIDHFHVELGYFKPTRILSLLKINFFSTKLMNLILAYPETCQTSSSKFHANRELTSVPAKKICSFSKFFFAGNFALVRCCARKVVRLGLRNFPLKQTNVTLVSWRFYAQCRPALNIGQQTSGNIIID